MAEYKLTPKMELFVQGLVRGESQRQAFLNAGYSNQKGNMDRVDREASVLLSKPMVSQRYNQLFAKHEKKALWTRERATNELLDLVRLVKEEQTKKTVKTVDEQGNEYEIVPIDITEAVKAIMQPIKELNSMGGFNKQNINMEADISVSTVEEHINKVESKERF